MRKIEFRDTSKQDVRVISEYIADNFGFSYIDTFLIKLDRKIFNLSIFPEIGRTTDTPPIYFAVFNKNRIYFTFTDEKIIFHGLKDTRMLIGIRKKYNK